MTKISIVIITFNEEKNIGRCLESLGNVADEIIVVDSFSQDKTREICELHGIKVIEHPFEGYIEQKNYALSQAKYPFILSLDADEALSDELRESIRQTKLNLQHDAYTMNRLTQYCGQWIRHGGWYPDRKLRLFNRGKSRWGGRNPHDRVIMDKNSKIEHLKGDILHYSFYTIDQHINTVNKFSEIKARGMFRSERKPSVFNFIINPAFRFFRHYFLKGGFLDGFYGYVIARNSAHGVFLKYAKLRTMWKNEKNEAGKYPTE